MEKTIIYIIIITILTMLLAPHFWMWVLARLCICIARLCNNLAGVLLNMAAWLLRVSDKK